MSRIRFLCLQVRTFFRKHLSEGFWSGLWFRWFQHTVKWLHETFSCGYRFKRWVAAGDRHTPAAAPELYQLALVALSFVWVAAIHSQQPSIWNSLGARIFGFLVATYFILELVLFLLDWLFVPGLKIENYRRSLATLIVSTIQAALLFSILFALTSCQDFSHAPIARTYGNWRYLVTLDPAEVAGNLGCAILAQSQWLLGLLLVGVIIASLLGPIVRPERKEG